MDSKKLTKDQIAHKQESFSKIKLHRKKDWGKNHNQFIFYKCHLKVFTHLNAESEGGGLYTYSKELELRIIAKTHQVAHYIVEDNLPLHWLFPILVLVENEGGVKL